MLTEGWVDFLTGPTGIIFAFAAGVISFLSPCVLPLVPAYIAHLTGVASSPEATAGRRETMSHAAAFVCGFGVVFTTLGASVGLAGGLIADQMATLEKIAGVFLIVLGLNLMGVIKLPWLYRTYTLGGNTALSSPNGGTLVYAGAGAGGGSSGGTVAASSVAVRSTLLSYSRSFGFGSSFAIAWTPCIGPVLGSILMLAAASSTVFQGSYLLLAYSAGLAVPFLITGFAIGSVTAAIKRFRRFLPMLEIATGALVLLIGVLVFLNEFTTLNQYFGLFPELEAV